MEPRSVSYKCLHPSANILLSGDKKTVTKVVNEFSEAADQFGGSIKFSAESFDSQRSSVFMTVEFDKSEIIPKDFKDLADWRQAVGNTLQGLRISVQYAGLEELAS